MCCTHHMIPSIHTLCSPEPGRGNVVNANVFVLIIINAKLRQTRELPVQTHSRTDNALIRPHSTD